MEIDERNTKSNSNEWENYVLTEEDVKKSPLLRNINNSIEKTKNVVEINKDKTKLRISNSFGDEVIYDLMNEKIISMSLGF